MNNKDLFSDNHPFLQEEYYGFLKPRMWDQYGARYSGVCLAFSKKKILKKLPKEYKAKNIEYLDYDSLNWNQYNVHKNQLEEEGFDKYLSRSLKKVDRMLFAKHLDYIGENEFRIMSNSINNPEFIDIKDALIGIIYCPRLNSDFHVKQLKKYADEFNVEILQVDWDQSGIRGITNKDSLKRTEELVEEIMKTTK